MKTSSAKAKGRSLQQFVAKRILAMHQTLTKDDVRSTSMGCGGADVQLSAAAKEVFAFEVECKAQQGYKKLYNTMEQAETHGTLTPIAVIRSNRKSALVIMYWDDFEKLINNENNNR